MKAVLKFLTEIAKTILIAALIVIPIRVFVFQPFLVRGSSMEPNYYQGDYLIVDQISYRFNEPQRGDVIVFDSPNPPERRFIKRIIGLPEEEVILEDGVIYIQKDDQRRPLDEFDYLNQETAGSFHIILSDNEYFVLGDNRSASLDSRSWGALSKEKIIGKVSIQLSPFSILAQAPLYLISK